MAQNKALLFFNLLLLVSSTVTNIISASEGGSAAPARPSSVSALLRDDKEDHEIVDLMGTKPARGSAEWNKLRIEKLEEEKKSLAAQLAAERGVHNIDDAIREFERTAEPIDDLGKHARTMALNALYQKRAHARISPDFFENEGAQRAAAERGYYRAMPIEERMRRMRERAQLARATREANGITPADVEFLKGQLTTQAGLDAHYEKALSDATPFHRELRAAVKEGFVGGISNGIGKATGTYLIRAIDWFAYGVYYNITSNRKRRDAAIAEAQREERMLTQRTTLNNNSSDLDNTANASHKAKQLIADDIRLLEDDRTSVRKLLTGMQPITKVAAVISEAESAIEEKLRLLKANEEERKALELVLVDDRTKETKDKLSTLLKQEKELNAEIDSLRANQKAATEKMESVAAQLDDDVMDLKDIVIASNLKGHLQQTNIISDELARTKKLLKKTDPANAKKIAAIKAKISGLEDAIELLSMQTGICEEMTNAETLGQVLRDHEKVQIFELFLIKTKASKNAEIAQAREEMRSRSTELMQRLAKHNSAHLKFAEIDESELNEDIRSLQGNSESQTKAPAAAAVA